jgi:hypothetical protein
MEAEMILGWWTELAMSQRLAELRREAELQCFFRAGRIRAGRIRLQHHSPWPGPAFLTQRGDRS